MPLKENEIYIHTYTYTYTFENYDLWDPTKIKNRLDFHYVYYSLLL